MGRAMIKITTTRVADGLRRNHAHLPNPAGTTLQMMRKRNGQMIGAAQRTPDGRDNGQVTTGLPWPSVNAGTGNAVKRRPGRPLGVHSVVKITSLASHPSTSPPTRPDRLAPPGITTKLDPAPQRHKPPRVPTSLSRPSVCRSRRLHRSLVGNL